METNLTTNSRGGVLSNIRGDVVIGCVVNKPPPEPVTDLKRSSIWSMPSCYVFGVELTVPRNADGVKFVVKIGDQITTSRGGISIHDSFYPPYPEIGNLTDGSLVEYVGAKQRFASPDMPPTEATTNYLHFAVRAISYNSNGYNFEDVEGSKIKAYAYSSQVIT